INATISKGSEELEGVIAAQGNNQNGYSLFIQKDELIWLVKQAGQSYTVKARKLPSEQFVVQARLMEGGTMSLEINGKLMGNIQAPSLFPSPLNYEKVRVGNDNEGENKVGDYAENFWFRGRMGPESSLTLRNPAIKAALASDKEDDADRPTSTAGSVVIKMGVIPHEMKFDKEAFTVKAGQQVTIDFENQDFMQHNLLIAQVGELEKVGTAADALARDPKGAEMNYIPQIPEVIIATRLVDPEGSE